MARRQAGGPTSTDGTTEATRLDPPATGVAYPATVTGRSRLASWTAPRVAWLLRPLGLYAGSRILVLAAVRAVISLQAPQARAGFAGPWPVVAGGHAIFRALASWDASWYLFVAAHGYFGPVQPSPPSAQIAFFPVWPAVLRYGARLTSLSLLTFGVGITFVVGGVAACCVWRLVAHLCGPSTATRCTALWAFFPGSFVLSLIYSEGLTVCLASVCLLFLLKRRWLLAGVAAGIATGVAPNDLVLIACCAWAAGAALRRERQWAALLSPILSLGGVAAYFSYLWVQSGSPWEWYDVEQRIWHSGGGIYHNTVGLIRVVVQYGKVQDVVATVGLAWVVLGFVAMLRWRPPAVMWIFTAGVVLAAFTSASVGPIPRMFLVAFPLMVAVVRWSPITAFHATLATSGFLLALLTVLTVGLTVVAP